MMNNDVASLYNLKKTGSHAKAQEKKSLLRKKTKYYFVRVFLCGSVAMNCELQTVEPFAPNTIRR